MTDYRRKPSPWEAAQIQPPASWPRRVWLSARIRWAAATTRPARNTGRHAPARSGNQRGYGGTSNG